MVIFNFGFLLTQSSPRARRGPAIEGRDWGVQKCEGDD